MKEYLLKTKIQNNLIVERINALGCTNISKFCKDNKLGYQAIIDYINFQRSPVNRSTGEFRPTFIELADVLKCPADHLITEEQLYIDKGKTSKQLKLSKAELAYTMELEKSTDPEQLYIESAVTDALHHELDTLTPRERAVMKKLFFENKTLEEVGEDFDVTRERIRQIEGRALRKLRHPSRRVKIESLLGIE